MNNSAPLLDTNIIIDVLNGHEAARQYLKSLSVLRVSSVSVFEVFAGCTGKRKQQLAVAREIFDVCEVIELTHSAAAYAAEQYMKAPSKNKILDYFIAGVAVVNGLELATRNPKDFKSVKAFAPYQI